MKALERIQEGKAYALELINKLGDIERDIYKTVLNKDVAVSEAAKIIERNRSWFPRNTPFRDRINLFDLWEYLQNNGHDKELCAMKKNMCL